MLRSESKRRRQVHRTQEISRIEGPSQHFGAQDVGGQALRQSRDFARARAGQHPESLGFDLADERKLLVGAAQLEQVGEDVVRTAGLDQFSKGSACLAAQFDELGVPVAFARHVAVFSRALMLGILLIVCAMATTGCAPSNNIPTPEQPIAFNHKVHIENELECVRCHVGAEEGVHAGLPPVRTCASCHRRVIPEHPEVQKILTAWEEKTPILWRKVNIIPEAAMVHFNHRAHARAEVGCESCHGDVRSMTVAEPVLEVANMGWCIDCHRESEATDDCLACHY